VKFVIWKERSATVSVTWGSWNSGIRRTVKSEREVKALAAVSLWPSAMYAVKVSTLTSVGMAFRMKLRHDEFSGSGQYQVQVKTSKYRVLTTVKSSVPVFRGHSTTSASA